jgi:hypothetical protein
VFELPWHTPTSAAAAIRAAWSIAKDDERQVDLPVAIYPMHVHARLQVQQSCFTIHGRRKEGLVSLMEEAGLGQYLRAIDINPARHRDIVDELRILGISRASLFPDLDGLAAGLAGQFWSQP